MEPIRHELIPVLSTPDYKGPATVYKNEEEKELLKEKTFMEYYAIGTEENGITDEAITEAAITEFYAMIGLPKPIFVWADSPFQIIKHLGPKYTKLFSSNFFSNQDAYWVSHYMFMLRYEPGAEETKKLWDIKIGVGKPQAELFLIWDRIIRSCSHWWPFESHVFVNTKLKRMKLNDQHMFHCPDGPAVEYADGEKLYFISSVNVEGRIIEHPETITIEEIQKQNNLEVKSILMDKYGFRRYFKDIGAKLIHKDEIPVGGGVEGVILRSLLHDKQNNAFLVSQDGSTERIFCMNVDPAAKTCAEAHTSISGIPDAQIVVNS